jgi:hypothetical protein
LKRHPLDGDDMRKTILIILLLLLPVLCLAGPLQEKHMSVIAKKNVSAPAGDSCTSGLLLSSHFENNDDVTQGTPAGCSAGADSTWARAAGGHGGATYVNTTHTGWPNDGTYSLLFNAHDETATMSVTSEDICEGSNGRFDLWIYLDTAATNGTIIRASTATSANINIQMVGTQLRFQYIDNDANLYVITTTALEDAHKYHVIARWRVGATDPAIRLSYYDDTDTLVQTVDNNGTSYDMGAVTNIYLGDTGGDAFAGKIDSLKIYSSSGL